MSELTHGMAGERHRHGMLCVNRPLHSAFSVVLPVRRDRDKEVPRMGRWFFIAGCSVPILVRAQHGGNI